MESVQCRNVAVWSMAANAAAAEVRGRAVRIQMSKNRPQGGDGRDRNSLWPASRDWRLHVSKIGPSGGLRSEDSATGSPAWSATVEKADSFETSRNGSQKFGSSEVYCDEGSSYVAVESVLEHEGGKSVEDYKLRAHIFAESDVFFTALKDRSRNGKVK